MQTDDLICQIERAFNGAPRPATSLRQFALTDQFGMSGTITKPQWDQAGRERVDSAWQDIPDTEIEECDCLLAHMQADAFRYYLPAYMRYAVKNVDKSIWATDVIGDVVFSLSPTTKDPAGRTHTLAQLALLDASQNEVIIQFPCFVSTWAGEVQRPAALKALERYWNHQMGS